MIVQAWQVRSVPKETWQTGLLLFANGFATSRAQSTNSCAA